MYYDQAAKWMMLLRPKLHLLPSRIFLDAGFASQHLKWSRHNMPANAVCYKDAQHGGIKRCKPAILKWKPGQTYVRRQHALLHPRVLPRQSPKRKLSTQKHEIGPGVTVLRPACPTKKASCTISFIQPIALSRNLLKYARILYTNLCDPNSLWMSFSDCVNACVIRILRQAVNDAHETPELLSDLHKQIQALVTSWPIPRGRYNPVNIRKSVYSIGSRKPVQGWGRSSPPLVPHLKQPPNNLTLHYLCKELSHNAIRK